MATINNLFCNFVFYLFLSPILYMASKLCQNPKNDVYIIMPTN